MGEILPCAGRQRSCRIPVWRASRNVAAGGRGFGKAAAQLFACIVDVIDALTAAVRIWESGAATIRRRGEFEDRSLQGIIPDARNQRQFGYNTDMVNSRRRSLSQVLLVHEIAFLFLVATTGLLSGLSAYFWQKTSTESIRINNSIYLSEQIRGELYRQLQEVTRARLAQETQAMAMYYEYSKRIGRHFNQLRRTSLTRAEDEATQALQQSYRKIQGDMYRMFSDPDKPRNEETPDILDLRDADRMFDEFEQRYLDFKALYSRQHRELEYTIALWTRYAPILIPVLFLLTVLVVIYTSRVIRSGFVRPMAAVMEGAATIRRGDLSCRIPERGVNEVQELAGSINRMATELKDNRDALVRNERQAALGSLIPVVAHNIRNPLASIRATAQLLEDPDNKAELKEGKQAIVETIDRLGRWVNALVSYLHPLEPDLKTLRVVELVDAALAPLQARLDARSITVKRENWSLPARVRVDPDLMEQAIYGLLVNAVDASPARGELRVSVAEEERGIVIGIRDYGSGLPFQPEPGNLEPGPSTKRFGTGLGIPIAFKICQSHGWELAFEAPEDGGSQVTITAPANGAGSA